MLRRVGGLLEPGRQPIIWASKPWNGSPSPRERGWRGMHGSSWSVLFVAPPARPTINGSEAGIFHLGIDYSIKPVVRGGSSNSSSSIGKIMRSFSCFGVERARVRGGIARSKRRRQLLPGSLISSSMEGRHGLENSTSCNTSPCITVAHSADI